LTWQPRLDAVVVVGGFVRGVGFVVVVDVVVVGILVENFMFFLENVK
jgi:hypothetical protein